MAAVHAGALEVPRFCVFEREFVQTAKGGNPYTDVEATATFTDPSGKSRSIPLFWDGGATWRVRFSPDVEGRWTWSTKSADVGLTQGGEFVCVASKLHGAIRAMKDAPHHFEYQDGTPYFPVGDTFWLAMAKEPAEKLDRAAVFHYVDLRAKQGFNWVQSAVLRAGGNEGGEPFGELAKETLRPEYFQECDARVKYMNERGITMMLFLMWGGQNPVTWNKFPSDEACLRFARYATARYAAYNVAFCASGEWNKWYEKNIDAKRDPKDDVRDLMLRIGKQIAAADPHGRMVALHVGSGIAYTREFAPEAWMSFGDFQQNYWNLHQEILNGWKHNKPLVNAEYAYFLRDQDGDGKVDKNNSATIDDIRHATWDVAMAGGYAITGFGTTYNGGHRDPGPFDPDAAKDKPCEQQFPLVRTILGSVDWWKLTSADELVTAKEPRGQDVMADPNKRTESDYVRPPLTMYWCLAEAGKIYVVYARGVKDCVELRAPEGAYKVTRFDPRTGERTAAADATGPVVKLTVPDGQDWVWVVRK